MKTVLFMGYQGGGKTTAIELTSRALTKAGLKVGTLKHIHDPTFTIDTPGKDTWRHARSGASVTVALSAREMTVILKRDTSKVSFDEATGIFRKERVDYLFVEGFYRKLSRRRVVRIVCARNEKEVLELLDGGRAEIACITGRVTEVLRGDTYRGIPLVRLPSDTQRLLRLIKVGRKEG